MNEKKELAQLYDCDEMIVTERLHKFQGVTGVSDEQEALQYLRHADLDL